MHGQIYISIDNKLPTEIILDDNNFIVQFGETCSQYLKEKGLEANHCFKDIKMNLYENKNFIIAKNSGKQLPLRLVIQKVLEKIKEIAIKEISESSKRNQ